MKVRFLSPASIDGISYVKGEHELDDSLSIHWYLLALVGDGKAVITEKPFRPVQKPVLEPHKYIPPPEKLAELKAKADNILPDALKAREETAQKLKGSRKRKLRSKQKPVEVQVEPTATT